MTLPKGNYGVTIQKTRLVMKEENEEHFIEMTTKVGKQLLSIRLPVVSIKWRKDKKGGGKAEKNYSWYAHLEDKSEALSDHEKHLEARAEFERKLNLESKKGEE